MHFQQSSLTKTGNMVRAGSAAAAPSTRARSTRQRTAARNASETRASPPTSFVTTRKRTRATNGGSRKRAVRTGGSDASDDGNGVMDGDEPNRSVAKRGATGCAEEGSDADADTEALLATVAQDTQMTTSKRKRGGRGRGILAEFASLDALLDNDSAEKERKQVRATKLKKLRDEARRESTGSVGGASRAGGDLGSSLSRMMTEMESNMTSLSADNHLFADDLPRSQERFGFVFTPITKPLPYIPFKATAVELRSSNELSLVYAAMQTTDSDELGALLWSKAILLRCLLTGPRATTKTSSKSTTVKSTDDGVSASVQPVVVMPSKISAWLFTTLSTHNSSHIVKGCMSNLFMLLIGSTNQTPTELSAGLPCVSVCYSADDVRCLTSEGMPGIQMEWRPSVYDFLNAFRRFGFQDSKRSMSAKSKITPNRATQGENSSSPAKRDNGKRSVPFPMLNMQHVLAYLVLSLRANLLRLDGYDAFSFTMFFLRMQFEDNMHPEIIQLASVCIEELLEVFPTMEWRKEWAPSLVLRIAGANEGLFDSASGWLMVARRLPRTARGTQLTTGLAIYVLQHRIDKQPRSSATATTNSERPLKFPIQSGLVLDIVAGIVEDMTAKYTEKKSSQKKRRVSIEANSTTPTKHGDSPTSATSHHDAPPPYDLLCKKVALMDLALQAFLNILTQKEMTVLLQKLDNFTGSHKSTMSAKWHELKTLVSLMHRKYSLENLRVGRYPSPSVKTVLFVDDAKYEE